MPLTFVNGGSPDYMGSSFTTTSGLLTTIRNTLVTAGWTTVTDAITASSNLLMRGVTAVNNHNCWVEFTVKNNAGVTNGKFLVIRGWLQALGTNKSPDDSTRLAFIETADNRLWMNCNQDYGCISILSNDGQMLPIHFGFADRISNSDDSAWYVGYIASFHRNAYVARKVQDNTQIWHVTEREFTNALSLSTFHSTIPVDFTSAVTASYSNTNYLVQGLFDRYTVGLGTGTGAHYVATGGLTTHVSQYSFNGNVNAVDNLPVLGEYFHMEGKSSLAGYTASTGGSNTFAATLYFRGVIQGAVVGLASLAAGVRVIDTEGNVYLSGGGVTYQGFRIA